VPVRHLLKPQSNRIRTLIGLYYSYINITITILDISHSPVYYLKLNVSETGFCPLAQMEHIQLGPIDRSSLSLSVSGPGGQRQDPVSETSCFK
jgi:hypothetical protein